MDNCIINPKTGRAVKKTGKIGAMLVKAGTNIEKAKVPMPPKIPRVPRAVIPRVPKVKAMTPKAITRVSSPLPIYVKPATPKPATPKPATPKPATPKVPRPPKEKRVAKARPVPTPAPAVASSVIDAMILNESRKSITPSYAPVTKRTLNTLQDRIKDYKDYVEFFKKYGDTDCLTVVKQGENHVYTTANKQIKLIRKIGTESAYGAVYLSNLIENRKTFVFASKVMAQNAGNLSEIKTLSKLSTLAIQNKNPHYPIMYHNFSCDTIRSDSKLPKPAQKKKYYMNLNELASGDLKMFLDVNFANASLLRNALAQIFLSILSYHKDTNMSHNDAHWGNFLFHKIDPSAGSHFKYNVFGKDIYIENLGYNWVIWDFGLSKKIDGRATTSMKDYMRIINAFKNIRYRGWLADDKTIPKEVVTLQEQVVDAFYAVRNPDFEEGLFDILFNKTNLYDMYSMKKVLNDVTYRIF